MSRCVCGHHEEMHFAGVKEGYDLRDSACCADRCACGRFRTEWDDNESGHQPSEQEQP